MHHNVISRGDDESLMRRKIFAKINDTCTCSHIPSRIEEERGKYIVHILKYILKYIHILKPPGLSILSLLLGVLPTPKYFYAHRYQSMTDNCTCAACGKVGEGLKTCTACRMVKYCNRKCQQSHRRAHKSECKLQAAKLHEEKLFTDHPPREECPICLLPLPIGEQCSAYSACCGKLLCCGCMNSMKCMDLCPFCRAKSSKTDAELIERYKKRMDAGDALAYLNMGCDYKEGRLGLPRDLDKAMELWHNAVNLGSANAHYNIGLAYYDGEIGGDRENNLRDGKKAQHHFELAAIGGDIPSRHNLAIIELCYAEQVRLFIELELEEGTSQSELHEMKIEKEMHEQRAHKHWMIAARAGDDSSMKNLLKRLKMNMISKEEYLQTLRVWKDSFDTMKSEERDKDLAIRDGVA